MHLPPRPPRSLALAVVVGVLSACGEDPDDDRETPPPASYQGNELRIERPDSTLAPDAAPVRAARAAAAGASVLLLTLDTVRADALGCYGKSPSPTPSLDRLAAEGVRFRRVLTPAPITLPSHASMLTGRVPSEHGALENGAFQLDESHETLTERLAESGRATAAFVSTHVLTRRYGLAQGFDHYDDRLDSTANGPAVERSARNTVDALLEWLRDPPPEPWFVWGHFYDAHYPWEPPEGFREGWSSPYEGEIAALDQELGRLLAAFDEDGRLDRTLVVVTSDHGEGLGEHGEETHGMLLYDTTLEVPLLLRHPSLGQGVVVEGQASLTDLFPTVLDLLSLPFEEHLSSVSLLPTLLSPEPEIWHDTFVETALPQFSYSAAAIDGIVGRRYKYIRAPRAELFDLQEDPDERDNLIDQRPGQRQDLHARVQRLQPELASRAPDAARELSADELARLEALGYRVGGVGGKLELSYDGMDPKDALELSRLQAQAQGAMARGEPATALQLYQRSLQQLPDDPSALAGKATALLAMQQDAPAREALDRCLALRPDFFHASLMLAQIEMRQGKFDAVDAHCERALDHNSSLVEAYLLASEACFRRGDHGAARRWLERAGPNTRPTTRQRELIRQRLDSLGGD